MVIRAEPAECLAKLDVPATSQEMDRMGTRYQVSIQEGPPPSFQRRLQLTEHWSGPDDAALVGEWLLRSPYYRLANDEGLDLRVQWQEDRGFVVEDATGETILPHPFRPTRSARVLCLDLENYAVYQNVRGLENPEGQLDRAIEFSTETGWGVRNQDETFERADQLWEVGRFGELVARFDRLPADNGRVPAVRIRIENHSDHPVFVGGYNTLNNWGVKPLGGGTSFAVPPGRPVQRILWLSEEGWTWKGEPVAGLPPESFKLFIAEEERDYSSVSTGGITDPEGMQSPPIRTYRSDRAGYGSSLDQLLNMAQGVRLRSDQRPREPMLWTTRSFEISVVPAAGQAAGRRNP